MSPIVEATLVVRRDPVVLRKHAKLADGAMPEEVRYWRRRIKATLLDDAGRHESAQLLRERAERDGVNT